MAEEYGIKNLNEVNLSLSKLVVLIVLSIRGRTFDWTDAIPLLATLPDTIKDIDQSIPEAKDISAIEVQELLETTLTEFQVLGLIDPDLAMPFVEVAAIFTGGIQKLLKAIQNLPPKE